MKINSVQLEPCTPPLWASEGHSQTLFGYFLPSPKIQKEKEIWQIPLDDGDQLIAEFYQGTSDIIFLLFHGLNGSSQADYMQRVGQLFINQGHSVLLVNHRGCGIGKGFAKGLYHSGSANDLARVIEFSKSKFPNSNHTAIGFSLGANALLLLLSDETKTQPHHAIAVNAPVDLERTSVALTQGFNKLYDKHFVLLSTLELRQKLNLSFTIPRSLREFDAKFTAQVSGFESREDYYQKCSTADKLQKIKTPTVILTAKDDPIIPWQSYRVADFSPSTHFHLENHGGHLGYLSSKKTPLNTFRWLDYAINEYVKCWV